MLIGAHISSAGGLQNAPKNAHNIGCGVFQFFSRSPRGGKALELSVEVVREFRENMKKYKQKECYIHAPYYINLASSKKNIYHGSISVLREELERGSKLGAKYLMTHLGSAKDLGHEKSIKQVAKGISEILKNYKGSCEFLMEMSAGSGQIIGDTFEEIAEILKSFRSQSEKNKRPVCHSDKESLESVGGWPIGICYDTAHAFESGYDMRDRKSVKKTLNEFDKILGLDKLKLIHINDSKTDLGSRVDRHEHIGKGKIGLEGFKALLSNKKLKNINLILETPGDEERISDIKILKNLR
ncbi:deoxyribonuclease IV [Candidatus Parcubacteria bacterium]|nr:deoxyribonuclease IV [Patescibacteria group bacterium]MCG2686930.1 deoxyribonuclease IV [Candidatus Parcubacteria bacterium]